MIDLCPTYPRAGKDSFFLSVIVSALELLTSFFLIFSTVSLLGIPPLPSSSLPSWAFIALQDLAQTFSSPLGGLQVSAQIRSQGPISHPRCNVTLSSFMEVIEGRNFVLLSLLLESGV